MYAHKGRMIVSASDVTLHLECPHLSSLDRMVALRRVVRPRGGDTATTVAARRGAAHEAAYVKALRAADRQVVAIPAVGTAGGVVDASRATAVAARAGAEVIYQATFLDPPWRGHADFLVRRDDRPSRLGTWSYDVADTKLSRRLTVPAIVQMAVYGSQLDHLQGRPPEWLTVITGDRREERFAYADAAAYTALARERLLAVLDLPVDVAYAIATTHCEDCHWRGRCNKLPADERLCDETHLSRVESMRRDHAERLAAAGIATVEALGATAVEAMPQSIRSASARDRLVQQARLQVDERQSGVPSYELLPAEAGRGLALLPAPSSGDLFFDIEGDPFVGDHGLEYLWGITDREREFVAYWGHDPQQERIAVEAVIDHIDAAWASDPGMHVYHYAPYEPSRLRTLTARHGTRAVELDQMLRSGRFVDLYAVVRQGLRVSKESYSIKQLEAFYSPGGRRGATIAGAAASIDAYEAWLESGDSAGTRDQSQLDAIARYNRDDCESTLDLDDWLEARRAELVGTGADVARPVEGSADRSVAAEMAATGTTELAAALLERTGTADGTREQAATALLAGLLGWHAREARADWWDYFRLRQEVTADQLEHEAAALGPLSGATLVRRLMRSGVWRYTFPPQDTKVSVGSWMDHHDGSGTTMVMGIDAVAGWVELKRASKRAGLHPAGLVPPARPEDRGHREALLRLGRWVRDNGIDAVGPHRAARDLLVRHAPRVGGAALRGESEAGVDALRRVAPLLDETVLSVQGPPGTGKTWAGARAILDLVRAGRRVAITANSHAVIGNLLDEVMEVAAAEGVIVRALQKAREDQRCSAALVDCTDENAEVVARLNAGDVDLVGGSSWLFARPDLADRFDVIVVEEAGQLALANALVVAQAARSTILLGDPQQLAQPTRDVHPDGAGASALGHVLGEHETIPRDRGLFFEVTHRLCPEVCSVVSAMSYEDRLQPGGAALTRDLVAPEWLGVRRGVVWWPVEHSGNRSASTAEAITIGGLVEQLLLAVRVVEDGVERALGVDDVLVITPYNAQIARLRSHLPAGVQVGTVDKFQGREAAVVIMSLAASSAEDAPRGVEFLLDPHRLNVAISRAQLLSIIVGSPTLLASRVRTPAQLRLVNALCSVAVATPAEAPARATDS